MPIEMKLSSVLQEALGMLIPSAEAGGISMQSAVAIKRLDQEEEDIKKQQELKVVQPRPEKGKTQDEVFKEVFGEAALKKKKEKQKKQLEELLKQK